MTYRLVDLDKQTGVCSVGIGETLRRALTKLVLGLVEDQVKVSCSNLHIFAGLEAVIKGVKHAVRQSRNRRKEYRLTGTAGQEGGA